MQSELVDAKQLREELRKSVPVEVRGKQYRVQPVSLMLFVDDPDEMWRLAREDGERLKDRLRDIMGSPSYARLRRVLITGMVHPKVVPSEGMENDGSICADTLLVDYELAIELYLAIAKQSMAGAAPRAGSAFQA